MAKISIQGLDMLNKSLDKLSKEAEKINRGALGAGAGMAADELKRAIEGMPTRDPNEYGTSAHPLYGATPDEKAQIANNFGIARFKTSGGKIETSIGFRGYVNTPSKKFNDNVPTGMLMQCINYGTSFRRGTHTVDGAIRNIKSSVQQKMQEYLEQETQKIMEV